MITPIKEEVALPSVAGRMEMTHADFQHACQVELARLQEYHLCDNRLVYLLCEAVRCSRECCDIATRNLKVPIRTNTPTPLEQRIAELEKVLSDMLKECNTPGSDWLATSWLRNRIESVLKGEK